MRIKSPLLCHSSSGSADKFQVPGFKFQVNVQTELETWNLKLIVLAVAEGFEPSHGRINSAVPYQLGYATECFWWEGGYAEAEPTKEGMRDEG